MKKKLITLLILMLLISTSLIACSKNEKIDEILDLQEQTANEESDDSNLEIVTEISNDIKLQAEKEGVSVKEMQVTLDGLAQLGAEKYGITKEEYIAQINENHQTVLSEWQLASENMGISITELYKYELARADNLTEEQKETIKGMNDALKMAEEELENMSEMGVTDAENMVGIYGNDSGEVRVVTMSDDELREALTTDTYEILQDYTDEYSINYEYLTDASYNDITEHYNSMLQNTAEYLKLEPMVNMGVMLQGTVNETLVYIEIDNSGEGMIRVNTCLDLTNKE